MKRDNPDLVSLITEIYDNIGNDTAFEETVVKILNMTGSRAAQYGLFDRGAGGCRPEAVGSISVS